MRGTTFNISKQEMMIFFNALIDSGYDKNLRFSVPLLNDLILFKFHLKESGAQVLNFVAQQKYLECYIPLAKKLKEHAKREIPSYGDVQQSLYQAGILKPSGLKQLEDIFSALRNQSVIRGGDVYYIALDTNLLRDRFFSVYLKKIPSHPNLDYILCETVRDELKNRCDKLDRNFLRGINQLKYNILTACFLNQNCLEDRMRYIGFLEYNNIRATTSCEEIDAPSKKSGRLNDEIILEAYSSFVDIGRKVIFISRDNEAVRMMTGEENVVPILLEHSTALRTDFEAAWEQFFDLLYLLSILYGKLNLVVGGIEICSLYGVWKGKDVQEWEQDRFLLEIFRPNDKYMHEMKDYQSIITTLKDNLSILKDLEDLGIG